MLSTIKKQFAKVQFQINTIIPKVNQIWNTQKRNGVIFLAGFFILSLQGFLVIFSTFKALLIPYITFITLVSLIGENIVSSKGHYTYYTGSHMFYVGVVPISILFLWLASIIGPYSTFYILLIGKNLPTPQMLWLTSFLGGFSSMLFDLIILEPIAYRKKLWLWRNKHRFYAPLKNYIVWFVFPTLSNLIMSLTIWLTYAPR